MLELNDVGAELSQLEGVMALTDVTGFGLLGHLAEMCEGSNLSAEIHYDKIPKIPGIQYYLDQKSSPGGTERNFLSYHDKISALTDDQKNLLFDPQTNGGLLIAVVPEAVETCKALLRDKGITTETFGWLNERKQLLIEVN